MARRGAVGQVVARQGEARSGSVWHGQAGNTKRGTLPRFTGGTMEDKDKPKRDFTPEQRRRLAEIVRVILTPDSPQEPPRDSNNPPIIRVTKRGTLVDISTPDRKIDALRRAILMLADGAHHDRITELLDALEQDVGHATLAYAARIVRVHVGEAASSYSDGRTASAVSGALSRTAQKISITEWDRRWVLP